MALHTDAAAAADAAARRRRHRAQQEGAEVGGGAMEEEDDSRRARKGAAVVGASRKLRGLWAPWVPGMLELAQSTDNHDLLAEVLGTLANMTLVDLPAPAGGGKGGGGKGGGRRRGESDDDDSEESESDGGKEGDEGKDGGGEDGEEYDGTMRSVRGGWMRLVDSHGLLPFLQRLLQPGFLQVVLTAHLLTYLLTD